MYLFPCNFCCKAHALFLYCFFWPICKHYRPELNNEVQNMCLRSLRISYILCRLQILENCCKADVHSNFLSVHFSVSFLVYTIVYLLYCLFLFLCCLIDQLFRFLWTDRSWLREIHVILALHYFYNIMMQVKKVDQEYHETVNRVMNTLNAMPEVVSANSPLHKLLLSLKADLYSLFIMYYLPYWGRIATGEIVKNEDLGAWLGIERWIGK